jgi:3',5'-cyclic AMP phosphodiesterase CpdA
MLSIPPLAETSMSDRTPPSRPTNRLLPLLVLPFSLMPLLGSEVQTPDDTKPAFLVQPYLQLPTPTGMTVMWETNQKLPGRVEFGTTANLGRFVEDAKQTNLHELRLTDLKPGTTYHYRVRSGSLVSPIHTLKSAPPPGTRRWRMALYGDSRSYPATHRKVAEQIAKAQVDLIVHTGDIVVNGKNYASWRKEFFEPLGDLARSVPWVSTIGNHERDSANYFSYMALPGNERYFGFDFANAHIVCLDSNTWIERGRDSEQYKWLTTHLAAPRTATWTFVVFHHPLFSAHPTRVINKLRWDWAPVFLDPAHWVDGVLTGHDHFYARNYRMGRLTDKPQPGVLFLTSAGGGAPLYPVKRFDYVALEKSAHHFTLFEYDDDRITLTPIDIKGEAFDRFVLTKVPTPAEEFCAYDIEELRDFLRKALASAPPIPTAPASQPTTIATSLQVPTRFRVAVSGLLRWRPVEGWKLKQTEVKFQLQPGQPLDIPLQAEVAADALGASPELTIEFDAGRFRNRTIPVHPFKLGGPPQVRPTPVKEIVLKGDLQDAVWRSAPVHTLIPLSPQGVDPRKGDQVRFLTDRDWLYVGARLSDPMGKVEVKPPDPAAEPSRLVLYEDHLRVVVSGGEHKWTFAITPEALRYTECDDEENDKLAWKGIVAQPEKNAWCVEMALPRKLFAHAKDLRINVVHHRRPEVKKGARLIDLELSPTYKMGDHPEVIPDWKAGESVERFARLMLD